MDSPTPEGWGVIRPRDRNAHYYAGMTSLCRRVGFYNGPLEPETAPKLNECPKCRKALTKRTAS